MKRPLTIKASSPGRPHEAPGQAYDESALADERVPVDLNAVRWVVAGVIAFWLTVFVVGCYFFGGSVPA